jgi:sporulation protein YlmC with PRC-barrel domain
LIGEIGAMNYAPRLWIGLALGVAICGMLQTEAAAIALRQDGAFAVAQAMIPPTGMGDADKAMAAAHMAAAERMNKRYPQPARVGDLIGYPVLDDNGRTLGYVRQVARTADGKIELIVAYNSWCGWCGIGARLIAVPIEVVGALGRQIASLDMSPSEFAAAPIWNGSDATVLGNDEMIKVALARR